MKKFKQFIIVALALGLVAGIGVAAVSTVTTSASVKTERASSAIPKKFRGTWYQYKNGKYYKLKVSTRKVRGKTSLESVNMKIKYRLSSNKIMIGGSGPMAPVSYLTYSKKNKTLKYTIVGDGGYRKSVTLYK